MSKENWEKLRKDKKVREKDRRMEQLEEEIARLESENEVLKRDRMEYENKFQKAVLRGVSTLNADDFRSLKASGKEDPGASTSADPDDPEGAVSPEIVEDNSNRSQIGRSKESRRANLKKK